MTCFDHNATSPVHESARKTWVEATERYVGNPSSSHRLGSRAEAVLGAARDRVASFLGADPANLVWMSGATEAANTAFQHLAATLPPDAEVWTTAIEHSCVLAPARLHFGERLRLIPVARAGVVDLDWLCREMQSVKPAAVAVMAANNETGVLQPWPAVRTLCREAGVLFVCDATQWLGKMPAAGLGECDLVLGSVHKCGGPPGVGFLTVPAGLVLRPLMIGGGQEGGRRAGTQNLPGILAAAAALKTREWQVVADDAVLRRGWRDGFERELIATIPGAAVVGADAPRLWNTSCVVLPRLASNTRWVIKLDKLGFAVSSGAACLSGHAAPSHVLTAMTYPPAEAERAVRFSAGWETTEAEWRSLLQACQQVWRDCGGREIAV